MHFGQYDSRGAAARGFSLQLEDPAKAGRKLFNDEGKPVCVILMGREAPEAAAHFARIQRARAKEDTSAETVALMTNEELHERMCEVAEPLIMGFENLDREPGKPATKADAGAFLRLQTVNGNEGEVSFVEQILAAVNRRAAILGNAPNS